MPFFAAGASPRPTEEYARKVIDRAYFLILNKIDELDGTNERLLRYYSENIEKHQKLYYNKPRKAVIE